MTELNYELVVEFVFRRVLSTIIILFVVGSNKKVRLSMVVWTIGAFKDAAITDEHCICVHFGSNV